MVRNWFRDNPEVPVIVSHSLSSQINQIKPNKDSVISSEYKRSRDAS